MERNSFFQRASTLAALLSALTVVHCSDGTIKNECAKDTDCKVLGDTCDPVDHACKPKVCAPKTCAELGKECGGPYDDGCFAGGVVNCPECVAPETCNRNTSMCQEDCVPDCGVRECGPDPVCGTEDCGTCLNPATCDFDTGLCELPCVPKTCLELGKECGGPYDDGCGTGGVVNCPECLAPETCNRDTGICQPDDGNSAGRIKITIDHTKVADLLSDFPLLVHLGKSSGTNSADTSSVLAVLGSDANRKKFSITTVAGTELLVEIERWDSASEEAWLWVKVPTISNSQDTVLYLDFDKNRADNVALVGDTGSDPAENVWSNGFVGVWHLAEQGSGVGGEYKDSTKNRNHATGGGGAAAKAPKLTTGKIGDSPDFDGNDDIIFIPDHDDYSIITHDPHAISISFWYSMDFLTQSESELWFSPLGKGDYSVSIPNAKHEYKINFYDDDLYDFGTPDVGDANRDQRRSFYLCDKDSGQCAGDYVQPLFEPFGPIPYDEAGGWAYFSGQASATSAVAYKNGVLGHDPVDYLTYGDNNIELQNTDRPVIVGSYGDSTNSGWFDGRIDELQISKIFRSDAWIKASYYSQNDALVSFSNQ